MKKTVFMILAIGLGLSSCDDDDMRNTDIPSVVINGFTQQFSNAKDLEWDKNADMYEAEFTVNNVEYQAFLNPDGTFDKYKYDFTYKALPQSVQASIMKSFDRTKIEEVEVIEILGTSYYQVEFNEEPNDSKIIFDESGQVTSRISTW
jgi:hypothetical protein